MLLRRSVLAAADNSGARNLVIIGMPGMSHKKFAGIGEIVTCVVRGASPTGQVKDHQIVKALIVRTRKETRRPDGSYIRFSDNAAVVCDEKGIPLATRIFGPVAQELKNKGFTKIISMAQEVI